MDTTIGATDITWIATPDLEPGRDGPNAFNPSRVRSRASERARDHLVERGPGRRRLPAFRRYFFCFGG